MAHRFPISKNHVILAALLIVVVVILSYLPSVNGEFIGDDLRVLKLNPAVQNIHAFKDCLTFRLQPARPISNFLIAALQNLSPNNAVLDRTFNILLHAAVTLLFFCLLLDLELGLKAAVISSLFFAVNPMNSDVIAITSYRWEILGALFCLCAMRSARKYGMAEKPHRRELWKLFFFLGCAQFSKEPYVLFGPAAALLIFDHTLNLRREHGLRPRLNFAGLLFLFALICMTGTLLLLRLPSQFPYEGYIGTEVLTHAEHLQLAGNAVAETLAKTFFSYPQSYLRLKGRYEIGLNLGMASSFFLLLGFALVCLLLGLRRGWYRPWGVLLGLVVFLYVGVPNIDIGGQHHFYFAVLCLTALVVPGTLELCRKQRLAAGIVVFLLVYTGIQDLALCHRLGEMHTRTSFRMAEIEHHPDSVLMWLYAITDCSKYSPENPHELNALIRAASMRFPGLKPAIANHALASEIMRSKAAKPRGD